MTSTDYFTQLHAEVVSTPRIQPKDQKRNKTADYPVSEMKAIRTPQSGSAVTDEDLGFESKTLATKLEWVLGSYWYLYDIILNLYNRITSYVRAMSFPVSLF